MSIRNYHSKHFIRKYYFEVFGEAAFIDKTGGMYAKMSEDEFISEVEKCLDTGKPLPRIKYEEGCVY